MARLAHYTLKYIDKSAGYKHDLFSDDPGLQYDKALGRHPEAGDDRRLMARLADGRKADHVLNAADKGGGVCRLMSFSLSNAAYGGQEGPLVYVALEAAADAPSGELTATLRQPVFTQADGTQVKWGDVSFAITAAVRSSPAT